MTAIECEINYYLTILGIQIRQMCDHGPRTMPIQPSRFMWNKWKDYTHFYVLVGAIPLCTLVFFVNVFIGPGTLSPIPEGYRPQPWEYYKVIFFVLFVFIVAVHRV